MQGQRQRLHRLVAITLGAVLASLTLIAGVAPAQTGDPFYTPPSPLPAGSPGDIIRAEPTTAYLDPARLIPLPARAWRVLYLTTTATGEPTAVSGTVLVPRTAYSGKRPIVGYSVGTHGWGDQCAPSRNLASGAEQEAGLMNQLLSSGWAVAVTDYEGLGTPGDHTYAVGRSEGQAVLDSIRAARRLGDADLPSDGPAGGWGYSQGGQAAAWTAQLQPTYAPDVQLAGVAAGGVPADLIEVAEYLDGSHGFALIVAAANGFDAAYPELDLESYLAPEGQRQADDLKDDCVEEGTPKLAFQRRADVTTSDPLATEAWQERLTESRIGGIAPSAPIHLYHAQFDDLIPFAVAQRLRLEWCGRGVRVDWRTYPLATHIDGAVQGAPAAVSWLRDRFNGIPAPSNC